MSGAAGGSEPGSDSRLLRRSLPAGILQFVGFTYPYKESGLLAHLESAVIQSPHRVAGTVHRGSADQPGALHLPDDSNHSSNRRRDLSWRCAASEIANGFSDPYLRAGARARLRIAWTLRGTDGNALWLGEHQPMALFCDGES